MVPFPYAPTITSARTRKRCKPRRRANDPAAGLERREIGTEIEKAGPVTGRLNRMEEASRKLAHGDAAAAAVDMIERS
jgi:hypothetical protein